MSHPEIQERCMNRLAPEKHAQLFGDGVHRFFLEERCTDRKMDGSPICLKCSAVNTSKKQYARTFPRGLINEPIPPDVHLFDSPWYHLNLEKWGAPSARVTLHALEFQQKARIISLVPSKVQDPLSDKEMPKKAAGTDVPKTRKPRVAKKVEMESSAEKVETEVKETEVKETEVKETEVKKTRKPRTKIPEPVMPMEPVPACNPSVLSLFQKEEEEKDSPPVKKTPVKRKAPVKEKKESPYDKLVHPLPVTHKDSCIPTHLEQSIEEQSLSDYETEDVLLSIFILDNVVYFRDSKKNKLYRRIKEKTIGPYIGRYEPSTDSIMTDIPDSDDECE
jgi:hypothetical protein